MDRIDDFDVIHFHTDMIHFPMFRKYADKTLTTLHGRLDMKDLPQVYERWNEFGLISISDDQRRPLSFANWKATVHHGMPAEQYKFSPKSEGYLAFLGRISPEKRPTGPSRSRQTRQAAEDGGQGRCRRPRLLRREDQAADRRQSADRVHRRDRRPSEVGLPGRRRGPAVPDRLARALRSGDDRGHGLRHACRRLPLRLDHRDHRGRQPPAIWSIRWNRPSPPPTGSVCWIAKPYAPGSNCDFPRPPWRVAISTSMATFWPNVRSPKAPLDDIVTPLRPLGESAASLPRDNLRSRPRPS
jgi:hypothetical protein